MNKKNIIGIAIFVVLIIAIIVSKVIVDNLNSNEKGYSTEGLTTVYVATGGGKEDFIADEDVIKTYEINTFSMFGSPFNFNDYKKYLENFEKI